MHLSCTGTVRCWWGCWNEEDEEKRHSHSADSHPDPPRGQINTKLNFLFPKILAFQFSKHSNFQTKPAHGASLLPATVRGIQTATSVCPTAPIFLARLPLKTHQTRGEGEDGRELGKKRRALPVLTSEMHERYRLERPVGAWCVHKHGAGRSSTCRHGRVGGGRPGAEGGKRRGEERRDGGRPQLRRGAGLHFSTNGEQKMKLSLPLLKGSG